MATTVSEKQVLRSAQDDTEAGQPLVATPADIDALGMIEIQRGVIRRRDYTPLGKLEKIMLGEGAVPGADGRNPLTHLKRYFEVSLDWQNKGPLLGTSAEGVDILIYSPMFHPPDLPDPTWTQPVDGTGRPIPAGYNAKGFPIPQVPPRIEQRLRDRCYGKAVGQGGEWLVFQPITQILFLLHDRQGLGIIQFSADYSGRHGALLFDPKRQEGHIVFGRKEIERFT